MPTRLDRSGSRASEVTCSPSRATTTSGSYTPIRSPQYEHVGNDGFFSGDEIRRMPPSDALGPQSADAPRSWVTPTSLAPIPQATNMSVRNQHGTAMRRAASTYWPGRVRAADLRRRAPAPPPRARCRRVNAVASPRQRPVSCSECPRRRSRTADQARSRNCRRASSCA
jgi:hypothetical protein